MRRESLEDANISRVEGAAVPPPEEADRDGAPDVEDAPDHVSALMMSGEVDVIFALQKRTFGHDFGAEFGSADMESARAGEIAFRLSGVRVERVVMRGVEGLGWVGRHQQVAGSARSSVRQIEGGGSGVEDLAHALADIEPPVAAGRGLVDRANAIGESLLHVRHLPFPLREEVC